jgi:hypothetical protein
MKFNFNDINMIYFIIFSSFLIIICVLFILQITTMRKLRKMTYKYNLFMAGSESKNLETAIELYMGSVNEVITKNKEIEQKINFLERDLLKCIKKIAVVRFNAFENVGSDLSFSIALLDMNDDGMVLSGIYSRESSATYAKPIISGNSKYPLSGEEIQAIELAKKNYR